MTLLRRKPMKRRTPDLGRVYIPAKTTSLTRKSKMKRTRMRLSKRARSRRKDVAILDDRARQAVFARDNYTCVRCGEKYGIQWSHVIGREHYCTRWETDNALTLCRGCHRGFWHRVPALAMDWFRKTWPERHEHILELYNAGGKVNPRALLGLGEKA